MVNKVVTL